MLTNWTTDGKWMAVDLSLRVKKIYDIYLLDILTGKSFPLATTWKYEQAPSFIEIKK